MRISQGRWTVLYLHRFQTNLYLGEEPQRLGWPPDFLRYWIKWYPEIPFWLPVTSHPFLLVWHFFLCTFQKSSTTKSRGKALAQRKGPYKKIQWVDLAPSSSRLSLFPSRTDLPFFSVESSVPPHIPFLPFRPFMKSIYLYLCLPMSSSSWLVCGLRGLWRNGE